MTAAHPWLSLDENLILRAGAGTGKTHALVTMALGLLGGLRRGQPVPPHQLWLLTFGDQAAGELRVRLRERLERLAASGPGAGSVAVSEPELAAAAEALGVRLPGADGWRAILGNLGVVNTKTLHGAGAGLLQELGDYSQSGFELLDADAADELMTTAAQEAILHGCAAGEAASLLEDFGYHGPGERALGLIDSLREMGKRIADDGSGVALVSALAVAGEGLPPLGAILETARSALLEAAVGHGVPEAARAAALLDVPAGPSQVAILESVWGEVRGGITALGRNRKHGATEARDAIKEIGKLLGIHRALTHTAAFGALLADVEERYRAAKSRRNALDFSDLCNLSRNLLRDNPTARRAAKAKVSALLLDETQDTSRVQFELCLLLCEQRRGEAELDQARPLAPQIELERGVLCAVGDRKQSIYEFRGANVAVFEELAEAVTLSHGRTELLQANRRSRPGLVSFVNRFFERSMRDGGPGAPGFGVEDALLHSRPAADQPAATLLRLTPAEEEKADAARLREARVVARRAAALLRNPPPSICEALGREPEPGDLAVLFRRLAHVELFRGALAEVGLPGVLLGGDGFWERAEVLDAITLLSAVIEPDDGLTTLALLRSPLCGISDASVARFAFAAPAKRLSLKMLWQTGLPSGLPGEDRADLREFGERLRGLRLAARGLGASGLLAAADKLWGLRALYADAQCSANLDKLEAKLALWQSDGLSLAGCVRRLNLLVREQPREPLEQAIDASERGAVRLLTVHSSKGLEFPVVFVVDCGATPFRAHYPALYARDVGVAIKGRGPTGKWAKPDHYASVEDTVQARGAAESLRLLYVAATRAREMVFFSGELPRTSAKDTWRFLLDQHGAEAGLAIETLTGEPPLATGPLFGAPVRAAAPGPTVETVLAESEPLPRLLPKRLPLAASAAGDLWLCPRRYQLRQLWQLEERPGLRSNRRNDPIELPLDDDPRVLGSQVHRLLEMVDLPHAARDLDGALREASARVSPLGVDSQLVSEARSVLSSALGQQMLGLAPGRVRREVPFVLRLGTNPTLVATGSIDLLLVLDDRVVVLDYKRGPPQERASYEAQVRLYALAARELTGGVLPIHAGLWFLRAGSADPDTFEVEPEELVRFRKELASAARSVAGRDSRRDLFPGKELRHCRAIGCGFAARCHGPGPA